MGIIRNQSIKNSISFYIGIGIGSINTILIYPNVFNDHPEHLGLIQILVAYAIIISTFTTLGIPRTFLRFFPVIKEQGQLYFLSLIIPLLGFIVASLCYFLFKEQLFGLLNASELLKNNFFYIIFLVFCIGFFDVLTAISRSFLSATTPIFINEVFLKLYSMSALLLHWFGYLDFSVFLQVYLSGYFLKFMILFWIQLKNDRLSLSFSVNHLKLKEILRFSLFVFFSGASVMIATRFDMMMIGTMIDLEHVAFYTVAFFIGNAIKIPGHSIAAISTPLIAQALEKKDMNDIQNIYSKSSINQLIFGGLFFICVWINIDDIFFLLPEKFKVGKWIVFYIALSQLFSMVAGVNGAIIVNSKYYRYDLYTNLILVLLTISTNYFLILKFGIEGAAMATAISVLIFNFIRLILIKVKMNMHPFSFRTIYTVGILFLIYLCVGYLYNGVDNSSCIINVVINIMCKSAIVCVLFIPIVVVLKLSEDISAIFYDLQKWISN